MQVQAFTNFAVATITRYAGMGILWEIYNEADLRAWTPAQYGALFISVGKAVRASPAIARELLVGPSTSTVACGYVQALKHMGALDHAEKCGVSTRLLLWCAGADAMAVRSHAKYRRSLHGTPLGRVGLGHVYGKWYIRIQLMFFNNNVLWWGLIGDGIL